MRDLGLTARGDKGRLSIRPRLRRWRVDPHLGQCSGMTPELDRRAGVRLVARPGLRGIGNRSGRYNVSGSAERHYPASRVQLARPAWPPGLAEGNAPDGLPERQSGGRAYTW